MVKFGNPFRPNVVKMMKDLNIDGLVKACQHQDKSIAQQAETALVEIVVAVINRANEAFGDSFWTHNPDAIRLLQRIAATDELACSSKSRAAAITVLALVEKIDSTVTEVIDGIINGLIDDLRPGYDISGPAGVLVLLGERAVKPLIESFQDSSSITFTGASGNFRNPKASVVAVTNTDEAKAGSFFM